MILGFKQTFPWGEPTNFREKILAGVGKAAVDFTMEGQSIVQDFPNERRIKSFTISTTGEISQEQYAEPWIPKIHTIREDKHDRWKAGRKIEMVYRGPKYSIADHFNKDIEGLDKCVSVQTISIRWLNIHTKPLPILSGKQIAESNSFTSTRHLEIKIDGQNINQERLIELARNDGFNSPEDFITWFSSNFTGKIIHFTNFKY